MCITDCAGILEPEEGFWAGGTEKGRFLPWIQTKKGILFLKAKDLENKQGRRKALGPERMENPIDDFYLTHRAIRNFYGKPNGKPFSGGHDCESISIVSWMCYFPQEMKDAWNDGELDGLLKHISRDQLDGIMKYAHPELIDWVLAQKHGYADLKAIMQELPVFARRLCHKGDPEQLTTSSNPLERICGHSILKSWEKMQDDPDPMVRVWGYANAREWKAMQKDNDWRIQLCGYAAANHWGKMRMHPTYDIISFVGYAAVNQWKAMKRSEHDFVRLLGYAAEGNLEAMRNDFREGEAGYIVHHSEALARMDWKAMQSEGSSVQAGWAEPLIGYAGLKDLEGMQRSPEEDIRICGYVAAKAWEAMQRDPDPMVSLLGYAATKELGTSDWESMFVKWNVAPRGGKEFERPRLW